MFMKKWLVASINPSWSWAKLSMVGISGDLEKWFRIGKSEVVGFDITWGGYIQSLTNHVNWRVIQMIWAISSNQKEVPFMLGIHPELAEKLDGIVPRRVDNSTKPLVHVLWNLWTQLYRTTLWKKQSLFIGDLDFVDEADYSNVQKEVDPAHVAKIRHLVDNLGQHWNLDSLLEIAFEEWKAGANDYLLFDRPESRKVIPRFTLFWNRDVAPDQQIIFHYLNRHPLLKKAFAEWMLSRRQPEEDSHFSCIKTSLDPRAHQYANIGITFLADECARDEGRVPVGHIQETV